MDIERERQLRSLGWTVRVFVRGVDVTQRCRFADDTPGRERAELYRMNDRGKFYLDEDRHAAVEIADDDIEIKVSR
jgi:hypothetical protein